MSKPLNGVRILDLTQFMSGPICTMLLADYGAEVIKFENPPLGDSTRYGSVVKNHVSSHFATRNRGKKSVLMNLKNPDQKALFLKMVETADAVIENFKPGTMSKFGIDYELLKSINPKIVYTSISGYGQEGPYANCPAFDQTVQAESGVMSVTGPAGGEPVKAGASIADYSAGLYACIGTLMGIIDAKTTGQGRRVDVSMMESLMLSLENLLSVYLIDKKIPGPMGNNYASSAPIGAYKCKDGKPLMVTVGTDAQWKGFCEAMEQPQWYAKPEWETMIGRANDSQAIDAEVNRVFGELTCEEVCGKLRAHNMVFGRINNFEDVANHPQVQYRKSFVHAAFPNGTTFTVPGNPMIMSGVGRETEYTAAELGQDTFAVLREVADESVLHELFDETIAQAGAAAAQKYAKS